MAGKQDLDAVGVVDPKARRRKWTVDPDSDVEDVWYGRAVVGKPPKPAMDHRKFEAYCASRKGGLDDSSPGDF